MTAKRSVALTVGLLLLSVGSRLAGSAQTAIPDEFQVRAAIIANLARFVSWAPPKGNVHTPMIVGLLGSDQQSAALEAYLSSHTIDGRAFQVRKLERSDRTDDCQIVYVSPSEKQHFEEIADSRSWNGVLTISDDRTFALTGGIVGLPVVGDRIEIQINLFRAQQNGLLISSRLLGLARVIRKADTR